MTKKEAMKAAQADVRAGKDRKQVFETYKGDVPRALQLASAIASVPRAEAKNKVKGMNAVLVVLLILAGIIKALGVFGTLIGENVALAILFTLLSVVIPFLFAYEVNRFNGQMYGILTVLGVLTLVNTLLHIGEAPVTVLVFCAFLGAIIALSVTIRTRAFPAFKVFGLNKDAAGNFHLG